MSKGRRLYILICRQCNIPFRPYKRHQKYCSCSCAQIASKNSPTRTWNFICSVCQKPFTAIGNVTKYCQNCKEEGHKRKRKSHYDKCPRCGALKYPSSKYCQKCYGETCQGENSHNWKGGKCVDKSTGYKLVYIYENGKRRYKGEHILIWEKAHNKKIPKSWIIHHINGIKSDNRIENLTAMPRNKHTNWTLLHIAQKRIRELEQLQPPFK